MWAGDPLCADVKTRRSTLVSHPPTLPTLSGPVMRRTASYRNQVLLEVIGASLNPEFSRFFQFLAPPDGASLVNLQIS